MLVPVEYIREPCACAVEPEKTVHLPCNPRRMYRYIVSGKTVHVRCDWEDCPRTVSLGRLYLYSVTGKEDRTCTVFYLYSVTWNVVSVQCNYKINYAVSPKGLYMYSVTGKTVHVCTV